MFAWFRKLFEAPACEAPGCFRAATGFGVKFRPRPAPADGRGRKRTDLRTVGDPVRLCPEHLAEYREDPDGFD